MTTLICFCGRANFTNLSRYSELNEKTYRRHYSQPLPFTSLNSRLIEQCSSPKPERIAAIDCTFLPKSGKTTFGLDYFYTGTQKPRGRKRQYSDRVDWDNIDSPPEHAAGFKLVATVDEKIKVDQAWVDAPAFKRGIQVVYLRKASATGFSTALLFCTDQSCSAMDVYRYYKARFQIEFIFRDTKQFLGLTHCQARDAQKLNFQVNSVLMTLNVLKVHWFRHQTSEPSPKPFSVANYKRKAFNQYLLQTFLARSGLEQTCQELETHYLQCLELGIIAS